MTDLQEKQLREYRIKGFGYKAIASVLNLSRDVVRNYCKSHSLEGYAAVVAMNTSAPANAPSRTPGSTPGKRDSSVRALRVLVAALDEIGSGIVLSYRLLWCSASVWQSVQRSQPRIASRRA